MRRAADVFGLAVVYVELFFARSRRVTAVGDWPYPLKMKNERRALTWIEGKWHDGNPPLLGPMTHATWQSSIVFDGARAFEGCTPDLDRHCTRVIASARALGL